MTNNCLYNVNTFETFTQDQIQEISGSIYKEVSLEIKQTIERLNVEKIIPELKRIGAEHAVE